jgi:NDP-sugar pyrophosphorylase family protein
MNGDSFCDFDLDALCRSHLSRHATATIVLTQVADRARYGRVDIDSAGRVKSFEEKAATHGPGWINAGVYLFDPCLFLSIPPNESVSLERQVFTSWIDKGLFAYFSHGRFLDIGTPESYGAAEHFFT